MRNKKVHLTVIAIFIIIIGICFYYIFRDSVGESIKLGLDLKGGTQIILKPVVQGVEGVTDEDIDRAESIIRDRIDKLGISEPLVTRDYNQNIIVQLPGVDDPERAKELIGKTAQLEFRLVEGTFISTKEQGWSLVNFDSVKQELIIDPDAEAVLVINDINKFANSQSYTVVGELVDDSESGQKLLVEYNGTVGQEGTSENTADGSETETAIEPDKIIGRVSYDSSNSKLMLVDYDDGTEIGEIVIDSRSGAATLVGPVLLTGNKLGRVAAGYDSNGEIRVALSFKDDGVEIFKEITTQNIGKNLAIVLDNEIKSSPYIRTPIPDGNAEITGLESIDEAKDIELVLRTGELPINLDLQESQYIGPTLGRDSLQQSILAGIIGLVLIAIFMVAMYRGLGLISVIGLLCYIIIFWGILSAIQAPLTLPGIAGVVLTIGIAVDANVLIFSRIKEEMLKGKGKFAAFSEGFKNALKAIIDSNITTLITAAALYRFGTGPIRGFAVTLAIGVFISMLTAIILVRSILFLIVNSRVVTPGFIGVKIPNGVKEK
ncbi:MAG: protein translocase subunit SecD [Actinobacteria bacterium]|nr:protein translocase subunit SecD [Actinomycetota bacterium]